MEQLLFNAADFNNKLDHWLSRIASTGKLGNVENPNPDQVQIACEAIINFYTAFYISPPDVNVIYIMRLVGTALDRYTNRDSKH